MADFSSVDKAHWIQDWFKSTEAFAIHSILPRDDPADEPDNSWPAKRSRHQKAADTNFTAPYNAPHRPTSTCMSNTSRGKRNATEMDQADDDLNPKSRNLIPLRRLSPVKTSQPRRRPSSPSKLKSSSRSYLELLEKPVHSKRLEDHLLPPTLGLLLQHSNPSVADVTGSNRSTLY